MTAQRGERVALGKAGEVTLIELRAMGEIGDARERLCTSRFDQPLRGRPPRARRPCAGQDAARGPSFVHFLERAVPLAHRHVDGPYLDAMPSRVAHELRRRVEAHRLRVQ
jgi:hypothetical protein